MAKIKNRLAGEQGFTLIELLVVIVILGILVAIAVPSYLAFRGNAQDAAAKANVRSAIPAAEGFYQVGSTYTAMDLTALQAQAPGVSPDVSDIVIAAKSGKAGQGYCISDDKTPGHSYYYIGGDSTAFTALASGAVPAAITAGTCSTVGSVAGVVTTP